VVRALPQGQQQPAHRRRPHRPRVPALARRQAAIGSVRDGLLDQRPDGRSAKRTFAQFIEKFWPLLERIPTDERWPADWNDPKHRVDFLNRTPDQIPAHL
jgi:hypothetical protein